ncbi:MAG: phosphotransferase [Caldilineaceae bacterium]
MIAAHDLPDDQALPQLAVALDAVMMQVLFQSLLFASNPAVGHRSFGDNAEAGARFQIESCTIDRVKYKAHEKCVISYRLQIYDQMRRERHEQIFCARVFPDSLSAARYRKACQEPLVQPRYGQAVMHLPALGMVLWAFPNDRKIGGIARLLASASGVHPDLAQLVAAQWGEDWRVVSQTHDLIHYVPEHTATVRVHVGLAHRPSVSPPSPPLPAATQSAILFGKAYYDDEGAESYRLMKLLWQSNACRKGRLRIAQPVAYLAEARILWQMGLPGRTLFTYALGSPPFASLLAEAAAAVATLHATALPCARSTHLSDWLTQLQATAQLVCRVRPQVGCVLNTVVATLLRSAPQDVAEPQATLHGDLHLQNFLVDETQPWGQRVALIDLDNLSTGSPWRDLGSFCAGLYSRGLVEGKPLPLSRQTVATFCAAYAHHAAWPLPQQVVDWYTAAALLNERVARTISRLKQGRLDLLEDFIWLAASLLSS